MSAIVIAVYADWAGVSEPLRLGLLHVNRTRGREVFEFEFDKNALRLGGPPESRVCS